MDFAICLDQFSTNFNVNNLSSNGFSIYTNLDNYTTPIAQNIPYQDLFPPPIGNCPLIVTLPQGATQLVVIDACTTLPTNIASIFTNGSSTAGNLVTQCCYAVINVPQTPPPPFSFCTTCSLDFDVFSSSYVGQIVAGNLTSACGTVTDYTIGWYKDGDYSSPEFVSGYGNSFLPYQNLHPLTGSAAVPSAEGNWEGIIHDIAINGITYSSISGSANGTPIPFESCFDTIVVDPLTCNNGPVSSSISKYSHQINYNSLSVGASPNPVSLTYTLDSTTKYFAYAFQAFSVWDELEIKFISGNPTATNNPSLYSQPIYLEKIKVGNDVPYSPDGYYFPATTPQLPNGYVFNGVLNNVWPKSYKSTLSLQRVLTLTTLQTSSNPLLPDHLEITITSNPINNNTQWKAGFQCLDTFDCTNCTWENYPNNLPKIWKLRLQKQYGSCSSKQKLVFYLTSSCPQGNSDWISEFGSQDPFTDPNINLIKSTDFNNWSGANISAPSGNNWVTLSGQITCTTGVHDSISCAPPSTGQITLNKTPNQIQLSFNLESDYLHYKNALINEYNYLSTQMASSPLLAPVACPSNSTSTNYFRHFLITIPVQPTPTAVCGDNTTGITYRFHFNDYFNIVYNENPSANSWSITIPQTPMVNCYSTTAPCDGCYTWINSFVNTYNSFVNSFVTYTFTTNVGAKYNDPIGSRYVFKIPAPGTLSGSYCSTSPLTTGYMGTTGFAQIIPWYTTNTVPFISSSTGWVNLYSLQSTLPCSTSTYPQITNLTQERAAILGSTFGCTVRFPHLTSSFNYTVGDSTNDFEIYSAAGFGVTGSANGPSSGPFPLPCPDPLQAKIYSYIGGVATVYTSSHFWQGNTPILIIDP